MSNSAVNVKIIPTTKHFLSNHLHILLQRNTYDYAKLIYQKIFYLLLFRSTGRRSTVNRFVFIICFVVHCTKFSEGQHPIRRRIYVRVRSFFDYFSVKIVFVFLFFIVLSPEKGGAGKKTNNNNPCKTVAVSR